MEGAACINDLSRDIMRAEGTLCFWAAPLVVTDTDVRGGTRWRGMATMLCLILCSIRSLEWALRSWRVGHSRSAGSTF